MHPELTPRPGLLHTAAGDVHFRRAGGANPEHPEGPDAPAAPAVILLSDEWGQAELDYLQPMLAMDALVVSIDCSRPGVGGVESLAAGAAAVIAAEAPGLPFSLVGLGIGAAAAITLAAGGGRAAREPAALVLIGGHLRADRSMRARHELRRALSEAGAGAEGGAGKGERPAGEGPGLLELSHRFSSSYLAGLPPQAYGDLLAAATARAESGVSDAAGELAATLDVRVAAAAVGCPTLVIAGSAERWVPTEVTREIFGVINEARYAEIPSGHAMAVERPAQLLGLIEDFLRAPDKLAPGTVQREARP